MGSQSDTEAIESYPGDGKKLSVTDLSASVEAAVDPTSAEDEVYPGDHGDRRAIVCSIGVFFAFFVGFGVLNIPGTFVTYWESNQLSQYSTSPISWIASLQFCLTLFGSVFTGRWFDAHGGRVQFSFHLSYVSYFCSSDRFSLFGPSLWSVFVQSIINSFLRTG
jgi:hypothetical protein